MATAIALNIFDVWREKYGGASVTVYKAGTTTKATLYDGEDTATAGTLSNPQTLDSLIVSGRTYGRWEQPVYVDEDVELQIDGEETGIVKVPILTMDGADASQAQVTIEGESTARDLRDWAADVVWAAFYGTLSGTATQNTATINAAAAAANANGGGVVLLPAGTITLNSTVALAAGVVLKGQGRGVTTLQAQMSGDLISLRNERCGLEALTLDGVNKTSGSVGIEIEETSGIILRDVEAKRFETNIDILSLQDSDFFNVYSSAGTNGVRFKTASGAVDGDDLIADIRWFGGRVDLCSAVGLLFEHGDEWVHHIALFGVNIDDNPGTAVKVVGAQYLRFVGCSFNGNTTLFDIDDVTSPSGDEDDIVLGFEVSDFYISGGSAVFADTCSRVIFRSGEIAAGTWTMALPDNNILLVDVTEGASFSLAGTSTRVVRQTTSDTGHTNGQTTGSITTEAWTKALAPGKVASLTALVTAVRQDADEFATFNVRAGARRPPSELSYVSQSANFTLGATLTGGTSEATATIVGDDDGGTSGTLKLINVENGGGGGFQSGETITDGSGGSATADGQVGNSPVLCGRGIRDDINLLFGNVRGIDADFVGLSESVSFQVTGNSSETWNWVVKVEVVES